MNDDYVEKLVEKLKKKIKQVENALIDAQSLIHINILLDRKDRLKEELKQYENE